MALSLKFAALCCALTQVAWSAPGKTGVASLRQAKRKFLDETQDVEVPPDYQLAGDGGRATLLVIPENATSGTDALVRISGFVEKIGPSAEDMWIRRVQIDGQWVKEKWAFKTGSGPFGDPALYTARVGQGEWTAPVNLLKASDGLLRLAIHDKQPPTHPFQQSTGQEIHLVIGPVTLGVKYVTSNKAGRMYNHLEVHVAGLTDVVQTVGGVLMGDSGSFKSTPNMAILQKRPTDLQAEQDEDEE